VSVIALDFYSPDDPNGTPLGGLDEADLLSCEFRVALTELGSGLFTVSRHNTQATSTLIREDNLVKVRIPTVSADPIFAFWLKEGDFTLISSNEQGGEILTFGGPGVLHVLSRARLHHAVYAPLQPNRGDAPDVPFMWRWRNEPYGAMLVRGIEEGQNEPGEPLADVTINFDRFQDSNSQPWPEIVEDFQTPIGTDVLTLAERLATGGDLFLIGRPNLEVRAYQEYGRDLTGSFASDNVRFEKGVNILTELKRDIAARDMLTHVIVQDSDGDYGIHEWSGYNTGDRATYGFLEVGQTNDPDQVDKIAQATLDASRTSGESLALEITPGFDPANGRYMPGPSGTDGHFWIGDTVTVHTGAGEHDFNGATQRVVAIRVVLHDAAVDTTDDTAARSFHVIPELNYLEIRGFSGVTPSAIGQPGFCCGPNPPTPTVPPGTSTPGVVAWSYFWDFETDNLDSTDTVHFMGGRINSPGALASWWGDSGGGSNAGLYERQAVTAGGSVNVEGSFAKRRLTTTSVSWFKILWFDSMGAVNAASSTTIGIGASGTGPGVIASVDSSTTVPAGIVGIEIEVDNNLTADNLTISHTAAATPGTGGTAGNGLPEIIGTGNVYSPINHQHYVLREAAPTITDDEEHGYPVGIEWRVVDDVDNPTVIYERWFLLDNTDGAAVWVIDTTGDAYTVPYGETTVGDYLDELAADVGDTVVEHGTTGASEDIDLADGLAHNATLGANTTFTFSGASSGEESRFRLYMRQDATGSRVPTFPASVVWPDDTEPTWSTAAGDVDVIEFSSIDGGVTWFGDAGGGASAGGATDLDGLTDVVITAPAEGDMLRFNGTNWVNTPGRWEPVTTNPGGGPELVWDGDELLMTWVDT
jgi:hypothetical protein